MSKDEVQAIIDEVDENKDGKLDYKEVITGIIFQHTPYIVAKLSDKLS